MKCSESGCEQPANPVFAKDELYSDLCSFHALKRWHKLSGEAFWYNVKCIECELGRRCDEHGKTGDEP